MQSIGIIIINTLIIWKQNKKFVSEFTKENQMHCRIFEAIELKYLFENPIECTKE